MSFKGMFLKFGELVHLEELRAGQIYCNTLQYFTQVEDNGDGRFDEDENVIHMKQLLKPILSIKPVGAPDSEYKEIPLTRATIKQRISSPIGNIFCVYALNIKPYSLNEEIYVDQRCKAFGSHFILIHNVNEFVNRIFRKLRALEYGFESRFVIYKDFKNFNGVKSWFDKDLRYDYQREFRLLVETDLEEPIKIDIGSLEDITSEIFECRKDSDIKFKMMEIEDSNSSTSITI